MDSYQVEITRSAAKDLRSLDKARIPKIFETIESLAVTPRPTGCKKLVGSEHTYRVRVGDYRVIYDLLDTKLVVSVIKVRHRKDAYR